MNVGDIKSLIAQFVSILGNLITYAIVAKIILSWISMGGQRQGGRFASFINDVTEPFLRLARKLPHRIGIMDLSPLIAIFGISFLTSFLVNLILSL